MRFISFTLLLFCLTTLVHAQNNYEWQLPVPTGHDYMDMQLVNSNVVVAVGPQGTFIRSTDGGITWQYHYTQSQTYLQAVYFINADTGYVAGINYCNYANLLKTTDGGLTWDSIGYPGNTNLNDVYFLNADTGWVVGYSGAIYCTHNGGLTWIDQSITTNDNFFDLFMLDANTGFVGGNNGHLRKTTDGGLTWNALNSGTANTIYSLYFISPTTGFLAAFGELIKRTLDGGQTWTTQYNYMSAVEMGSIFFTDSLHGFAVSPYRFYRSTNGGVNWSFTSDYAHYNNAAAIGATGNGFMVGSRGNIQKTINNGTTWTAATGYNNGVDLQSIMFTDKTHGWAVGGGRTLLRTTDGVNWTKLYGSTTGGASNDVCFLNNNLGYIVGEYGIVYKTTNGGTTLTNVNVPGGSAALACVHFINSTTGWVGGNNGALFKTTNGGTSWTTLTLPSFVYFIRDLFFVNANIGYVGATNNEMFKTTDGGTTWTTITTLPFISGVNHIQFLNADTGWVCSEYGMTTKTTDGGVTWQAPIQLGISPAYGMHFYDAMNGFVGGGTVNCDAKFYRTNDGGLSWQNTHLPFAFDINSVYMTDTNSVYIAGDYGNIIHYGDSLGASSTGIANVQEAKHFTVYPNPASTQFTITCGETITNWRIADMAGRILISGKSNVAEIIVTTQGLADGIYFVTLQTGNGNMLSEKVIVRKGSRQP